MTSRRTPLLIALVGVAVAVAVFFVVRDDGGSESPSTTTQAQGPGKDEQGKDGGKSSKDGEKSPAKLVARIVVRDGEPVGGVQELSYTKGEDMRFTVRSDADHEIHLHGYDVAKEVPADGRVEFDVPADIEGVFEVEIEETATQIAEITVNPS